MGKKTILIDVDDREHFFLAVEAGTIRVGDTPAHTEGIVRNLRITRIHCEVEVEDDRDSMAIDEPGVISPRSLSAGSSFQLGHSHLNLVAEANGKAIDQSQVETSTTIPVLTTPGGARWLRVVDGADQGRLFRLPDSGKLTVGKSGKDADIGLDDMYVMRVQCALAITSESIQVTHLEGVKGTLIDGERLMEPRMLKTGNVLRVGNSHLRLETGTFPEETSSQKSIPEGGSGVLRGLPSNPRTSPKPTGGDSLATLTGQDFGQFQIGKILGRGHTSAVYQATNSKTGQVVALKVLATDFPAFNSELERFAKEFKAVQNVRHVNLVAQLSAGRTGAHCWIARELVEGESAENIIARIAEGEKPSWTRATRVAIHLARALDCVHQHRLVHGNVTPRNVLIQSSDHAAKLADLRLAQALEGSHLQKSVRDRKRLMDLPYQAPEQAEADGFVDSLADIYGIGSLVYALVTGKPPASGKTLNEILPQIRTGWIARPSSIYKKVPADFDAIVMKLLARHQEDRYQTCQVLLADLEAIAQQHEIKL